ncbi:Hsp33 family molecular chaperone HslO [Luteimonas gilva]|uniref:Hsp33 family molecular chaperone HslO n=1 Tax=Luteimonas gilva TaxID=2572684 RepID=A0A4U5JMP1_9GAMM|nr:Hsp33 family molecular chaperone HslO [Luteimonas gilva]TKR30844.1 Hsp33 family molecular chaperone HslO [Luteimonas gilva]
MTVTPENASDRLTRFLLPHAGVRGVHVHLRDTWRHIRDRAEYPAAVAELLGEAAAATALFTGHAKIEGRLSVQLRGTGALRALFAECTAAGTLRGIAQLDEAGGTVSRDLRALGEGALLAITIENPNPHGRDPTRYQGLVPIESESLAGAFEDYFRQSEQLPTRLLLAADGLDAAGLMLQKLPGDSGDDDGWARATALFDTLGPAELLATPGAALLHRLFHEEEARTLAERPLAFACSCSRERVAAVLESLGQEEARAALHGRGVAEIRCEFCGQQYRFDPDEIDALFAAPGLHAASPDRLQ